MTLLQKFLTIFGDIKIFRWPLFLLYHPVGYGVKGEDVREVIDTVRPGDILVRGYRDYLDGHFIPGYFSHVGIFVGELTEADRPDLEKTAAALGKGHQSHFRTGKQMVVHALAEGVLTEDVINFCRCDYMAVLRFPEVLTRRDAPWTSLVPDGRLSSEELALRTRLDRGEPVPFSEFVPCVLAAALGKLGSNYDFDFDFERFDELSCSELAYFATKAAAPFLGVGLENRRVLGFKRSLIEPDAFVRSPLDLVWHSASVDARKLQALRGTRGLTQTNLPSGAPRLPVSAAEAGAAPRSPTERVADWRGADHEPVEVDVLVLGGGPARVVPTEEGAEEQLVDGEGRSVTES